MAVRKRSLLELKGILKDVDISSEDVIRARKEDLEYE